MMYPRHCSHKKLLQEWLWLVLQNSVCRQKLAKQFTIANNLIVQVF
jgi:hypothetical protein